MTAAMEALWRAARTLRRPGARWKRLPPLLFFTDPVRTPRPGAVLAALPRGAGIVFRAFGARGALAEGRTLARLARRRGVKLLVGADAALAAALRADGVHLPERLCGRAGDIARLRRRFLVTGAAHGAAAIRRARRSGVDAVVISPVFPSRSPSAGRPLGPRRFAVLARGAGLPAYALGGVTAANIRRLRGCGAIGVAAIGAFG